MEFSLTGQLYQTETEVETGSDAEDDVSRQEGGERRRKVLGFIIPGLLFHFFWWAYMIRNNTWSVFNDKYFMSIVMIFGSAIAGKQSNT